MSRIQELEEQIARNAAVRAQAEEKQYEADLEARIALEAEHGPLATVKPARFVAGFPTRAYARIPTASEYKRYKDQIHRAVGKKDVAAQQAAAEQLARSCWLYPPPGDRGLSDEQQAMLDRFPGILTSISIAALALAEGKADDEGKD